MTTTYFPDPDETGEIPRPGWTHDATLRFSTFGVGERTGNLAPFVAAGPVMRRPDVTGEFNILIEMPYGHVPAEDAGLTLLDSPPPGNPPPFPRPPSPGRGRHRARAPFWARLSVDAGLYLLGVLTGAAAVLAWAVTQ